jgi:DNA-binding transcriptional regulator YdaS (Cro superfamily)
MEGLRKAISLAGGQAKLAERVSSGRPEPARVGHTAIANWLQRGQVPAEQVIAVARAVEYSVTPHELRPDLYPHQDDGLPSDRRERPADILDELAEHVTAEEAQELFAAVDRGPEFAIGYVRGLMEKYGIQVKDTLTAQGIDRFIATRESERQQ